jgi:hypothetical protein
MLDLLRIDRSNIDLLLWNLRTQYPSVPPFYEDYYYGKIPKLGKLKPKSKIIRKDFRAS